MITLGNLQNNGGATPTLAINANSPAHSAGENALAPPAIFVAQFSDQRGATFVRISDATVDIGACELQPLPEENFRSGFE